MTKIQLKGQIIEGLFIKRINRFSALVKVNEKEELVYVPNSGRMEELLLPGTRVNVIEQDAASRKTKFDLVNVFYEERLVSIDSRIPNRILETAWENKSLAIFKDILDFKREVTVGNSRLDFVLEFSNVKCFVEAKSVTLVEEGVAKFPDAPTQRGSKHLLKLTELVQEGMRAAIIFVIQREDARSFTPNRKTDPDFAENLKKAKKSGVEVYAFSCQVTKNEIKLYKEIPIVL